MSRYFRGNLVHFATFFAVALWFPATPISFAQEKVDKAEAAKNEIAALQGTWKLVSHEENGKDEPQSVRDTNLYVFDKDKLTVKRNGEVLVEGSIELDATRTPKHVDLKYTSGQTELAIYLRVGDYLIQCGRRDGKTRPSEFTTGTANGGEYLIVLKREK